MTRREYPEYEIKYLQERGLRYRANAKEVRERAELQRFRNGKDEGYLYMIEDAREFDRIADECLAKFAKHCGEG